jgi:hypothetical protein
VIAWLIVSNLAWVCICAGIHIDRRQWRDEYRELQTRFARLLDETRQEHERKRSW